jgi:error-prone DNA polymerase
VRDAREHGVEVRPPCVNASMWDCTLEPTPNGHAVRLGLRLVDGLGETAGRYVAAARGEVPYRDLTDFRERADLGVKALEALAKADAFAALGLDRRAALWAIRGVVAAKPLPLFAAAGERRVEPAVALPRLTAAEEVVGDYRATRLSLRGHLLEFLRDDYARRGVLTCARLAKARDKSFVRVAGVVLVRQRPGNGNVVFITIEDETGIANIVVWPDVMERFRPVVMGARLMIIEGHVERLDQANAPRPLHPAQGEPGPAVPIIHLVARRLIDASADLHGLSEERPPVPVAYADEIRRPTYDRHAAHRHPRNVRILPGSRDFH